MSEGETREQIRQVARSVLTVDRYNGRASDSSLASAIADRLAPLLAQARREGAEQALAPLQELFSGGPDTVCRTTWLHPRSLLAEHWIWIECVEVPMADLREAFARADAIAKEADHA